MSELCVVESLGQQGDGLVRTGESVLHIPKVLPGETIRIEDTKLIEVVALSPERQLPFCNHYATCGGCKFQHWQEKPYAEWKRQKLVNALKHHKIDAVVDQMIDAQGAGRRRVVFHVRQVEGVWQAGFMEARSHQLTALESCPVLVPALQASPAIAAGFGPILGPCDVAITKCAAGIDIAVKAERKAVPGRLKTLQLHFEAAGLQRLSVNGEVLFSRSQPEIHFGKAAVRPPAAAFLQATAEGEAALSVLVSTALRKRRRVADLFCGLGPFTFRLAETAAVHAVDTDKEAVVALSEASKRTSALKPISTEVRDLFRNPLVATELKEFDAVVLDPPRAGAEAQVKQLAKSRVDHIAYVSCDVTTFARDAAALIAAGFQLLKVTPVDQFKWTAHIEMVGVFQR